MTRPSLFNAHPASMSPHLTSLRPWGRLFPSPQTQAAAQLEALLARGESPGPAAYNPLIRLEAALGNLKPARDLLKVGEWGRGPGPLSDAPVEVPEGWVRYLGVVGV